MQNCGVIKKTWIILDTWSTDTVTTNLDCVEEVNNCAKDEELTLFTNGGSLIFDRKGHLTFLPLSVYVNDNSLATILSLKDVNNIAGVCMTMYTLIEKAMNVVLSDGTDFKFK